MPPTTTVHEIDGLRFDAARFFVHRAYLTAIKCNKPVGRVLGMVHCEGVGTVRTTWVREPQSSHVPREVFRMWTTTTVSSSIV